MFLGIEIVKSKKSKNQASEIADYIVSEFKRNFIIMSTEGVYGNILKFKPPMCFSLENAKHWLTVFRTIIENLNATTRLDLTKLTGYLQFNNKNLNNSIDKENLSVSLDCQSSEDSLDSLECSKDLKISKITVSCN